MKIIIAGAGTVGQAVWNALAMHPNTELDIYFDDPGKGRYFDVGLYGNNVETGVTPPDGVIVCVSTPRAEDGSCDTSNVSEVFKKYGTKVKYLVKSAVDPVWISGQNEEHKITYSPEFLRGSHVHADATSEFLNQTFAIYGGSDCRWWDELFRPVLLDLKEVRYTTLEQASFAKYVENTFLATKVTFFNEMYRIYETLGFEGFDAMVDAITLDPRIGKSHTQVPGPDGKFGYGGHCLPKDMSALRHLAETPLLDAVANINEVYRP